MKISLLVRKTLTVFLIFSLMISLFACTMSDSEDITEGSGTTRFPMDSTYYDNIKDYKIIAVDDGEYRIVFDEPSVYLQNVGVLGTPISSWEDFCDRLLNGNLSWSEKVEIYSTFPKDEQGVIILNPYVSYKISHNLPYTNLIRGTFYGDYYSTGIRCSEKFTEMIDVTIISKSFYDRNYKDLMDFDSVENIESEITLENGNTIKRYNKEYEDVGNVYVEKYGLSDGTKKVYVQKEYWRNEPDCDYLGGIFVTVNIDDNVYFTLYINLLDSKCKPLEYEGEIPDDEFWFGFNVEIVERVKT